MQTNRDPLIRAEISLCFYYAIIWLGFPPLFCFRHFFASCTLHRFYNVVRAIISSSASWLNTILIFFPSSRTSHPPPPEDLPPFFYSTTATKVFFSFNIIQQYGTPIFISEIYLVLSVAATFLGVQDAISNQRRVAVVESQIPSSRSHLRNNVHCAFYCSLILARILYHLVSTPACPKNLGW